MKEKENENPQKGSGRYKEIYEILQSRNRLDNESALKEINYKLKDILDRSQKASDGNFCNSRDYTEDLSISEIRAHNKSLHSSRVGDLDLSKVSDLSFKECTYTPKSSSNPRRVKFADVSLGEDSIKSDFWRNKVHSGPNYFKSPKNMHGSEHSHVVLLSNNKSAITRHAHSNSISHLVQPSLKTNDPIKLNRSL